MFENEAQDADNFLDAIEYLLLRIRRLKSSDARTTEFITQTQDFCETFRNHFGAFQLKEMCDDTKKWLRVLNGYRTELHSSLQNPKCSSEERKQIEAQIVGKDGILSAFNSDSVLWLCRLGIPTAEPNPFSPHRYADAHSLEKERDQVREEYEELKNGKLEKEKELEEIRKKAMDLIEERKPNDEKLDHLKMLVERFLLFGDEEILMELKREGNWEES
jgi:hypothetical protein